MSAADVQPVSPDTKTCVVCELPIEDGHLRGMGDGSGSQFAHDACYWRKKYEEAEDICPNSDDIIPDIISDPKKPWATLYVGGVISKRCGICNRVIHIDEVIRGVDQEGIKGAKPAQVVHEVCYWRAEAEKWEAAYHDNKTIGDFTSELQDRAAMTDNLEHLKAKIEELVVVRDSYWADRKQLKAELLSLQDKYGEAVDLAQKSGKQAASQALKLVALRKKFDSLENTQVANVEGEAKYKILFEQAQKERDTLMKAARTQQEDRMIQDSELITLREKFDDLESALCTEIDRGAGWQRSIQDLKAANRSLNTNLQNTREECRKELRKANKDLGDALDAVRSSDEILEIEPGGIYKVHLNVKHRIEQLEAECFSLAAGACPVDGGLVGGEGGTSFCTLVRRQEGDLGKIVSWAAGELCQSPVAGDVEIESCGECAPCLAKEIKEKAH